jgi:hypothetical protein
MVGGGPLVPEATVLISSFDGYSDCWGPVAHGFSKYWPDCPFPIRLMTGVKDFPDPRIQVIPLAPDRGWSNQMLKALPHVDTPFVLYFQEDYWLNEPVHTARLLTYLEHMKTHGLNYLRLLAKPLPDHDSPLDPRLGILADGAEYRTSVQIAFWRREVLLDLIVPGESAWDFELNGTKRSRKYGATFLSVKRHLKDDYGNGIRYLCSAVNQGKWSRRAHEYAAVEHLAVDFSKLPTDTWWDDFRRSGPVGYFARDWAYRLGLLAKEPRAFWRKTRARLGLARRER